MSDQAIGDIWGSITDIVTMREKVREVTCFLGSQLRAHSDAADRLDGENAALRSRIAALEKALEPFAEEALTWGAHVGDDLAYYTCEDCGPPKFTIGDLRFARAVLSQGDRTAIQHDGGALEPESPQSHPTAPLTSEA